MAATPAPLATTKEPTNAQRKLFAKMGLAMPDGSFYIRNGPVGAADLGNAIEAVGRGEQDGTSGDSIRTFIMKRAKALGLTSKIPDTWNSDGSLKQDAFGDDADKFLEHFGVKGMQWRSTAQRQAAEATATAQGQKGVQAAKAANTKGKADAHDKHLLHLAHLLRLSKAMTAAHTAHVTSLVKTGQSSKVAAANTAHAAAQEAVADLAKNAVGNQVRHSDFSDDAEDFLAHFGVKGMHWGVRHTREELESQAAEHERKSVAHIRVASQAKTEADEVATKGVNSAAFKRVYGDDAPTKSDWKFYGQTGQSKAQALQQTHNNLRLITNQHIKAANRESAKAKKLRDKAATLDHDAFEGESIEHFGVKGMRWGVERSRTARTDDNSKSADAARARATADTIKKHGINAVSNADLQHLVNRSNLEKQHASLSDANRSDGRKFLDKLVDDQVNAAQREASKVVAEYAAKGAVWLAKEGTKQLLGTKSGTGKHA